MVSPPEKGILKYSRYKQNNIIVSDSALHTILPPQLKKMYARHKVMNGYECWISSKKYAFLLVIMMGSLLEENEIPK